MKNEKEPLLPSPGYRLFPVRVNQYTVQGTTCCFWETDIGE